ncbi:DUF2786 domain-containing protein [Nocardia amamiensis]|uniref:DUF2786 domain-containing protein n=1 Tax=Nocardia amamiensis TaxID=404578 RepID=UPI00082D798C|nr:DUF2786 domain-containing protein [Nocardia amamiensis]
MATERSRDTMAQRIGHLLNQADNAANEAEAEAFRNRAMQLIAKTGIEESEARSTLEGKSNDVIMALTFQLTGQFLTQQRMLLVNIAAALHCSTITLDNSRNAKKVQVFGVKIHTERVQLLFSILNPRMIAGATRLIAPPGDRRGTRALRLDWMLGYVNRINERLSAAEESAAATRDAETGTTTQALVLVSDLERARAALDKRHPDATKGRTYRRRVQVSAYDQGRAAGERADLAGRAQLD